MKKSFLLACLFAGAGLPVAGQGAEPADTLGRSQELGEVVVTGTRNATDVRHLPMTLSVVGRPAIENRYDPSLYTVLNEQVPGFFATSRGVMGYGVSDGAAGSINVRGIGGNAQMLVLIDGHPQYMGLFGHPISDAYQTMLADRVEVLRGPASVLYGSNAMGGVINIVTRKMQEDGIKTHINIGGGSYGSGAQAICRRRFPSRMLEHIHRHPIHQRAIHLGKPCRYGRFYTLEPAYQLPLARICVSLRKRRKPLGTTLRNHGGLSHAESDVLRRNKLEFLNNKCLHFA